MTCGKPLRQRTQMRLHGAFGKALSRASGCTATNTCPSGRFPICLRALFRHALPRCRKLPGTSEKGQYLNLLEYTALKK